jgi:hypothetical protein
MESLYHKQIFQLAKDKKDEIFFNSSKEHASIVHQAIMKYATDYVYIYSSSLCTEISNNSIYCDYVDDFLGKNANHLIKIVLTNYDESFLTKPLALILNKYNKQVEIKSFKGKIFHNGKEIHFTVSDDCAFRLETDIEKHMAYGNFNGKAQAMNLKNLFLKVFSSTLVKPVILKQHGSEYA